MQSAPAAGLYLLCIVVVGGFQAALIGGAPWGHLTQGGRYICGV